MSSTQITVKQLAEQTRQNPDDLLKRLNAAGLEYKSSDDVVKNEDVNVLAELIKPKKVGKKSLSLKKSSTTGKTTGKKNISSASKTPQAGAANSSSPVTLRRKKKANEKVVSKSGSGKKQAVQVEVLSKRTYVQNPQAAPKTGAAPKTKAKDELKTSLEASPEELRQQAMRRRKEEEARQQEERKIALAKAAAEKAATKTPSTTQKTAGAKTQLTPKAKAEPSKGKPANRKRPTPLRKTMNEKRVNTQRILEEAELLEQQEREQSQTNSAQKRKLIIPDAIAKHAFVKPKKNVARQITLSGPLSVKSLAERLAMRADKLLKALRELDSGLEEKDTQQLIDPETASIVAETLGHQAQIERDLNLEERLKDQLATEIENAKQLPRAPVVTIMGHVDHGKTTLLDYIRKSKIADKEAGGITQHIGAYQVGDKDKAVTFIDTPGHQAFSAMRARGAQVTDIVVLVVAGDDGVNRQTEEALEHAKQAETPLVVAITKMDKENANAEAIIKQLGGLGVKFEQWGGDTQCVEVSAKTGLGIDKLMEALSLQAELMNLRAAVNKVAARGVVLESRVEKGRGVAATVLVQHGTLCLGDLITAGTTSGRVRQMLDDQGAALRAASPAQPVQILGLAEAPAAGEPLIVMESERGARELVDLRKQKPSASAAKKDEQEDTPSLDELFSEFNSTKKTIKLVIKADERGVAEAIEQALPGIGNTEVEAHALHSGIGPISESDVSLAAASEARLIGFNVRADSAANRLAEQLDVKPHYYSLIYELLDDVKAQLSGLLTPEQREQRLGTAEVKQTFRSPNFDTVAGCVVTEGKLQAGSNARLIRNGKVVFQGALSSLRRFKEDVKVVENGVECGVGIKNYSDIKTGDLIEIYQVIEVKREL